MGIVKTGFNSSCAAINGLGAAVLASGSLSYAGVKVCASAQSTNFFGSFCMPSQQLIPLTAPIFQFVAQQVGEAYSGPALTGLSIVMAIASVYFAREAIQNVKDAL